MLLSLFFAVIRGTERERGGASLATGSEGSSNVRMQRRIRVRCGGGGGGWQGFHESAH